MSKPPRRGLRLAIVLTIGASVLPVLSSEAGLIRRRGNNSPAPAAMVRGVYGRDSSASGYKIIRDTGFNTVTINPSRASLNDLAGRDLMGVVWLGNYLNKTCSWERDRQWIKDHVSEVARHDAISAYQIADEPNGRKCPEAPEQLRSRHELVKSLDPMSDTYVVVSAWDGRERFPYQKFADVTDVMGLDIYPCNFVDPECTFEDIGAAISEARADGVTRFWAVIQDFTDGEWYRSPTAEELETQFDRWGTSGFEGYFVYHWEHGDIESKPKHLEILREQNARPFLAS